MAQMMRTHARGCLFGIGWYCSRFRGSNCPKKNNFGGVDRRLPAKRAKYWNVHIIKTTVSIITKFRRVIVTAKYSLWMVQMRPKQIQDGKWQPFWKILIYLHLIDQFWWNLALLCVSTLSTQLAKKFRNFSNSIWQWRHLENLKNCDISTMERPIMTKFWYSDSSWPSRHCQPRKFCEFENPIWRRPPCWKIEKS